MSCELLANRAHRPINVEHGQERTNRNKVTHSAYEAPTPGPANGAHNALALAPGAYAAEFLTGCFPRTSERNVSTDVDSQPLIARQFHSNIVI